MQDGPAAGQSVSHVHIHCMPRYFEDIPHNDEIYDMIDDSERSHATELERRSAPLTSPSVRTMAWPAVCSNHCGIVTGACSSDHLQAWCNGLQTKSMLTAYKIAVRKSVHALQALCRHQHSSLRQAPCAIAMASQLIASSPAGQITSIELVGAADSRAHGDVATAQSQHRDSLVKQWPTSSLQLAVPLIAHL